MVYGMIYNPKKVFKYMDEEKQCQETKKDQLDLGFSCLKFGYPHGQAETSRLIDWADGKDQSHLTPV